MWGRERSVNLLYNKFKVSTLSVLIGNAQNKNIYLRNVTLKLNTKLKYLYNIKDDLPLSLEDLTVLKQWVPTSNVYFKP